MCVCVRVCTYVCVCVYFCPSICIYTQRRARILYYHRYSKLSFAILSRNSEKITRFFSASSLKSAISSAVSLVKIFSGAHAKCICILIWNGLVRRRFCDSSSFLFLLNFLLFYFSKLNIYKEEKTRAYRLFEGCRLGRCDTNAPGKRKNTETKPSSDHAFRTFLLFFFFARAHIWLLLCYIFFKTKGEKAITLLLALLRHYFRRKCFAFAATEKRPSQAIRVYHIVEPLPPSLCTGFTHIAPTPFCIGVPAFLGSRNRKVPETKAVSFRGFNI